MKRKAEPKKFYFVEVNPKSCSAKELELHLRAFGNEFIEPSNLNRWTHIIFERPEKAKNELSKLGNCINNKVFSHIDRFRIVSRIFTREIWK